MKIALQKKPGCLTEIRFVEKGSTHPIPDFEAKANTTTVAYEGNKTIIYAGLGESAELADHCFRTAAALAVRRAIDLKRDRLSLIAPAGRTAALAAVEGAILGTYSFSKYRSEPPYQPKVLEAVSAHVTQKDLDQCRSVCDAVCMVRDLVNDNASIVNPAFLAREARTLARKPGFSVTILDERAMEKQGLGLLAAVGRGSATPPRLILIEYRGNPGSRAKTAIVGKGITFDSGGLNLKPTGSIETMREDMAGAATVLGIMQILAAQRPKINVVGVLAAAHNAISGSSYFPGDVYRSYSGKTVEICNTDAEGRLVLADAISYCARKSKPTTIIDLATLTGAILTTFGDVVAGLFSNNDDLAGKLFAAGETTRERLWRLPMYREYSEAMKGDHSDLRNLATFKRGQASSITGAAFIQEFCEGIAWAHLDIAGVAFNENDAKAELSKGGTGWGVRLLWEFLKGR